MPPWTGTAAIRSATFDSIAPGERGPKAGAREREDVAMKAFWPGLLLCGLVLPVSAAGDLAGDSNTWQSRVTGASGFSDGHTSAVFLPNGGIVSVGD